MNRLQSELNVIDQISAAARAARASHQPSPLLSEAEAALFQSASVEAVSLVIGLKARVAALEAWNNVMLDRLTTAAVSAEVCL